MFVKTLIQDDLRVHGFDHVIVHATGLVLEAGEVVWEARKNQGPNFACIKSETGPWDMVTTGDGDSQRHITTGLLSLPEFKSVRIFAEEKDDEFPAKYQKHLMAPEDFAELHKIRLLAGVDGIDGTANYYFGRSGYGIQCFLLKYGKALGSCIYCPEINGGLIAVSQLGVGVRIFESASNSGFNGKIREPETIGSCKQSLMLGDSLLIEREYAHVVYALSQSCFTETVISSAVMFANLLSGKVNIILHRPRPSYDCGPGIVGVQALAKAGQPVEMCLYKTANGKIEWLEGPDWGGETGIVVAHKSLLNVCKPIIEQRYGENFPALREKAFAAGA